MGILTRGDTTTTSASSTDPTAIATTAALVDSDGSWDCHEGSPLQPSPTRTTTTSSGNPFHTIVSAGLNPFRPSSSPFSSPLRWFRRLWLATTTTSAGLGRKIGPLFLVLSTTITIALSFHWIQPPFRSSNQLARLRGKEPLAGIDSSSSPSLGNAMKLSLWLIPPGSDDDGGSSPLARTQTVIDELVAERKGPRFLPHVTLAGGIRVASEAETHALVRRLREGLAGFGPVGCAFGSAALGAETCWNQALVVELVLSESPGFARLCRTSRSLVYGGRESDYADECLSFPPPLGVPHMSLYYGDDPPPPENIDLSRIFGNSNSSSDHHEDADSKNHGHRSFRAHRVMLWKTDPSTAEGVPEWEPLADIELL